ncbi:MAG TPA: hypothetical protein PLS63_00500 [Microthrixaceae bacterium]|nr:hypothetical protein [Microthrixaceae bacterium]
MAALLAAVSAVAFGVGDFLGGLSARRMAAIATTLVAQLTGLLLLVVIAPIVGGTVAPTDLAYGAAAGLVGAGALMTFYWALSAGQMSVVAPVSAVTSALVPLVFGLIDGERPGVVPLAGALVALPAIVLISREPTDPEGPDETDVPSVSATPSRVIAASVLAGVGFGSFLVLISRSGADSGLWPLTAARAMAIPVIAAAALVTRSWRVERKGLGLALGAGVFDVTANASFLFASRIGLLTLVGVLGSMYPASTVVLARVVLKERLAVHQLTGLGLAVIALIAIAAG